MNDRAVGTYHSDPFNALLFANVLNDLFSNITLIHKHCVAGTRDNHVGNLRNMPGSKIFQILLPVFEDKQSKQNHRRAKGDEQVQADFDPEVYRAHL
jgi:hypothetical protein